VVVNLYHQLDGVNRQLCLLHRVVASVLVQANQTISAIIGKCGQSSLADLQCLFQTFIHGQRLLWIATQLVTDGECHPVGLHVRSQALILDPGLLCFIIMLELSVERDAVPDQGDIFRVDVASFTQSIRSSSKVLVGSEDDRVDVMGDVGIGIFAQSGSYQTVSLLPLGLRGSRRVVVR
jgi:hypothetical protein